MIEADWVKALEAAVREASAAVFAWVTCLDSEELATFLDSLENSSVFDSFEYASDLSSFDS